MRNIAEIIEDDRNGKRLSQTERQIAVAYIQGKYDAVRELKISSNTNANVVLDKIRAEILEEHEYAYARDDCDTAYGLGVALDIIDKYKAESEKA